MGFMKWAPVIIFRETWSKWRGDNSPGMAASLAYFGLFATVPLLLIIISFLGSTFGRSAVQHQLITQIGDFFGPETADFVLSVANAARYSRNGVAALVSVVLTIWGALGIFSQLKWSMDKVWQAPPRQFKKWWYRFFPDLGLFAMVLIFGFIMVVSSLISAIVTIVASRVDPSQITVGASLFVSEAAIFFVISWILFATIFYVLPNIRMKLSDTVFGSMCTALIFTLGRILISLYLQFRGVTSLYGAASAVIIFLLWIYFSAQIFYFGAEFTYVYANRRRYIAKYKIPNE